MADHKSIDDTRNYAENFGCTVIEGGRPAIGRNRGARIASGDILAFVDADVVLPPNIIDISHSLFEIDRQLSCLHFRLMPLSRNLWVKFCYLCLDRYVQLAARLGIRQGVAGLVIIRREIFEASGGYDEGIEVGEDVEFLKRTGRYGTTLYLRDQIVFISARRFAKDGAFLFPFKVLYWGFFHLVGVRNTSLLYDWDAHDNSIFLMEEKLVQKMTKKYQRESKSRTR